MLWKQLTNAIIQQSLVFKKGAVLKVTNSDNSVSTVDLAELAALDGIAASDLAKIDGITNGTAAAGKALVLGASSDIDTFAVGSLTGSDSSLGITGQATAQGGAVAVAGGTSSTSGNAGGAATLTGGTPGATGVGGAATIAAGIGGATSGAGGVASVSGGAGTAGNSAGGIGKTVGGAGQGSAAGGKGQLTGGAGGATGDGGAAEVAGGIGGATSGTGGAASVIGGAGTNGNAVGGLGKVAGGAGQGTAAGGKAQVIGGASGAGATGNGADAEVTGGAALSTNGSGGSVVLTPGVKTGSGIAGGNFMRSSTGMHFRQQTAQVNKADGAETITAAQMINGIVVFTVTTGRTLTTPTGAAISAGCPAALAVGDSFDLHVITVGTGADDIATLTAGDGNVTFVGNVTVGPDSSTFNGYGTWRFRNTGADTWVGYRIG